MHSKSFSASVYGGNNKNYLWFPNHFPYSVYGGKNNEYMWIPDHFSPLSMAGRTTNIFVDSNLFDGKNYDYLEVPKQSPSLIMAGRATSVCGIQTNFCTMLIAGRLTIIRATEGVRAYP